MLFRQSSIDAAFDPMGPSFCLISSGYAKFTIFDDSGELAASYYFFIIGMHPFISVLNSLKRAWNSG